MGRAGMKVLLDENLPHAIRRELPGNHDLFTAAYVGWSGIDNGQLLQLAATDRFDVVVTNDRGLEYQQNLDRLPMAVVVILAEGNTIEALRSLYREIVSALASVQPRQFVKLSRKS